VLTWRLACRMSGGEGAKPSGALGKALLSQLAGGGYRFVINLPPGKSLPVELVFRHVALPGCAASGGSPGSSSSRRPPPAASDTALPRPLLRLLAAHRPSQPGSHHFTLPVKLNTSGVTGGEAAGPAVASADPEEAGPEESVRPLVTGEAEQPQLVLSKSIIDFSNKARPGPRSRSQLAQPGGGQGCPALSPGLGHHASQAASSGSAQHSHAHAC
jgi:hypothetical protein